jgi:hypothetical protein
VRAVPIHFIVVPDHADHGIERIIAANERFLIVENRAPQPDWQKKATPETTPNPRPARPITPLAHPAHGRLAAQRMKRLDRLSVALASEEPLSSDRGRPAPLRPGADAAERRHITLDAAGREGDRQGRSLQRGVPRALSQQERGIGELCLENAQTPRWTQYTGLSGAVDGHPTRNNRREP